MDTRLLIIAAPLLVAASWAIFNIGRLAIQQLQRLN
jgi:photosystem II PsbY protein